MPGSITKATLCLKPNIYACNGLINLEGLIASQGNSRLEYKVQVDNQ